MFLLLKMISINITNCFFIKLIENHIVFHFSFTNVFIVIKANKDMTESTQTL